jgi:hypothetical protein
LVWYREGEEGNEVIVGVDGNRDIILTNREAVILSLDWKIHGFALYRSEIFKGEHFLEENFDSDEFMTRKLLFKSNKVAFCDGVFYYRQDNDKAITMSFTTKNYYSILTRLRIYQFLVDNHFESDITSLYLLTIYRLFITLYRFSSQRKAINSDFELHEVRSMMFRIYFQLDKRRIIEAAEYRKGFKRIKTYFLWGLFFNFTWFRIIMYFIYVFDKV